MKMVQPEYNPFYDGMIINSMDELASILGMKRTKNNTTINNRLSHYCEWHKEWRNIVIDKAFDEVIPFGIQTYQYEIGEIVTSNTGQFKIIDRYKKKSPYGDTNSRAYWCKCMNDGYEFELFQNRIKQGIGCPVCGNRKLIPGIRSLYDSFPEVLKFLVNPEDAKTLTPYSDKKVLCKCPRCGNRKFVMVSNLVQFGFACSQCSDYVSYPNKFVRCFLDQLKITYWPENSFSWSDGKVYDQYIPDKQMIIENHGCQHYKEVPKFRLSLKDVQKNDKYKEELALNNGILHYIVLDCRHSNLNHIKSSILNSKLVQIFGFNEGDIDWELCDEVASYSSDVVDVCELYKTTHNLTELAEITNHDIHTISQYLRIGAKCGLCDFEVNNSKKNGRSYSKEAHLLPIYCETDDLYFHSRHECEDYYKNNGIEKFNGYRLYKFINSKQLYKGKMFNYITKTEFNNAYDNYGEKVFGDKYKQRYIKEE